MTAAPRWICVAVAVAMIATLPAVAQNGKVSISVFAGRWTIEGMFYTENGDSINFQGTSSWEITYDGRYAHEQFAFNFGGKVIKGEAFVGESKRMNRFELVQIDNANPFMIVLSGRWEEATQALELESPADAMPFRWRYKFFEDGSFRKEICLKQRDGSYKIQSQYRYKKM